MWKKRTYLDIAAGVSGNPSSPHAEGRRSREQLKGARVTIARLTEVKSDDVIFTSGATESNALAILGSYRAASASAQGAADKCSPASKPHMLYLPSAHASVVENMKIAESEGAVIEPLPIQDCRVDCEALAKLLRPETVLVSMDAVCGETGVMWNTREVARTLVEARRPHQLWTPGFHATLHVDASQATWTEKLSRAHFGADLMTLDASKVCATPRFAKASQGTRGIGCLIAPRAIPLTPLYGGGGQERGLRPGSEAPVLAAAFAEGLSRAVEGRAEFRAAATAARAGLINAICAAIPDALVNEGREQAPHILNISLPGRDTDYLVALLDEAGFAVSTKSACETDSGEGSRAVFALWGDAPRAASTLRISWGPATSKRALAQLPHVLIKACAFIDSGGAA